MLNYYRTKSGAALCLPPSDDKANEEPEKERRKGYPSMNKISRKGFLKIAAAAAMSGVTAGALAA